MDVDIAGEILNLEDVKPLKAITAVSRVSPTNYNSGNSVSNLKFGHEDYQSVDIVKNPDQIIRPSPQLEKDLGEHKKMLRSFIKRCDRYETRHFLTVTLCSTI